MKKVFFLLLYCGFLFSDEPVFCEKQAAILQEVLKFNDRYKDKYQEIVFYGSGAVYCLTKENQGEAGEESKKPNDIDIMVPSEIFIDFVNAISKMFCSDNGKSSVYFIKKPFFLFDTNYCSVYQFSPKKHIADIVPYMETFARDAVDSVSWDTIKKISAFSQALSQDGSGSLSVLKPAAMAGLIANSLNSREVCKEIDECLRCIHSEKAKVWCSCSENIDRIRTLCYLQERMAALIASHKALYKDELREEIKLDQEVHEKIFLLKYGYCKRSDLSPKGLITFSEMVRYGKQFGTVVKTSQSSNSLVSSEKAYLKILKPWGEFNAKVMSIPKKSRENGQTGERHNLYKKRRSKESITIPLENRFDVFTVEPSSKEGLVSSMPYQTYFNEKKARGNKKQYKKRAVKKYDGSVNDDGYKEETDSSLLTRDQMVVVIFATMCVLRLVGFFYGVL